MKPTGATREWRVDGFEINDGARSIVRAPHPDEFPSLTTQQRASVTDASQKNLQLIVTAVNERERLLEIARLTDALIVKLYDKHLVPYLMEYEVDTLRSRIHAVLNDATPGTSAGGGVSRSD